MGTLHVTPGYSAARSLAEALGGAQNDTRVISCPDDLSCGPIASYEARAAWWEAHYPNEDLGKSFLSFLKCIEFTDEHLVLWFGRHSSMEHAFFLAIADLLEERPYSAIDVTGKHNEFEGQDAAPAWSEPAQAASLIGPLGLRSLLGSERPLSASEKGAARRTWRRLRAENSPFRIVTEAGLVSASLDRFDPWIMERVTTEWRKSARVIGETMAYNQEPYIQVGDAMLLTRVVALIDNGKIQVEGDPWDMHASRLRLPQQ